MNHNAEFVSFYGCNNHAKNSINILFSIVPYG
jgi:hypothetical protein